MFSLNNARYFEGYEENNEQLHLGQKKFWLGLRVSIVIRKCKCLEYV